MQEGKACFNPCEWRGLIYLCGSGSLEAFSPETETFLPFLLTLPDEDQAYCVYVDSDQLVVHSYCHVAKFGAGEHGQPIQLSATASPPASKQHSFQPVLDTTRRVFYLVYLEKCVCFRMETGEQMG